MLKFGLGALLESTDSKEEDVDFEEILGRSESGEWMESEPVGRSGQTTLEGGATGTEGVLFDTCCVYMCMCTCVHAFEM